MKISKMRNQLSNPIKYKKIIVIEALFMTILLHGILLVLFTPASSQEAMASQKNSGVTLLNVGKMTKEQFADFKNFLNFNNPAMFSSSHNPHGYSGIWKKQHKIAFENSQVNSGKETTKHISSYEKWHLTSDIKIETSKHDILIDNLTELDAVKNSNLSQIKYPIAIGDDGSCIPLVFSQAENKLLERYKPGNTIIRVNYTTDGILKLNIMQSSGQRNLDLLSYRLLYRKLQGDNRVNTAFYTVYYREDMP